MNWVVVLVLMAPVVVLIAVARNQRHRSELRSATVELRVDEFGARRELADGRCEEVEWTALTEVEVVTARSGPHASYGGVVVLGGDDLHGCLVPLDRIEETGLLDHLQRLPGFQVDRFVAALEARPPTRTTVWSASPAAR